MQKALTPMERLVVAADFRPTNGQGKKWARAQVLKLADKLKGTGVYLKVNSALRLCGYGLVNEIQTRGVKVFADLKLCDIPETLGTDGFLLQEEEPELLTVMCTAGVGGMRALKSMLPSTEVLGVTALTSLTDADTQAMFACPVEEATLRLAQLAADAEIDGLISSPKELAMLRAAFGNTLSLNTPAIRPKWSLVSSDDQNPNRVMTPAQAIKAGADRIVVGRPIVQCTTPYDAAMWTIEEIASALA